MNILENPRPYWNVVLDWLSSHLATQGMADAIIGGIIGAGFGAFLGYRLARHLQTKEERLHQLVDLNQKIHEFETSAYQLINRLIGFTHKADLFPYLHYEYQMALRDLLLQEDANLLIYVKIKAYLPEYLTVATAMRESWVQEITKLPIVPTDEDWANNRQNFRDVLERFKERFRRLRRGISQEFFPPP
jgi:hypothetical protein